MEIYVRTDADGMPEDILSVQPISAFFMKGSCKLFQSHYSVHEVHKMRLGYNYH